MTTDRNFDNIAHKFAKNIYDSEKGAIRQHVLWRDLEDIVRLHHLTPQSLHILDAGGGMAQMSQKLAQLGHRITLCDLSSEMLALAQKAIINNGLLSQYQFIHSSVQNLDQYLVDSVDLLLFHAVMEWLSDPKSALLELLDKVKPQGMVSIMFYNHHALVYKNAICGNIPHVLQGMPHKKRFKLQPQTALVPEEVMEWITQAGFEICGKSGIRCFSDYLGQKRNMGSYELSDLLELEARYSRQEPYCSLGRYVHIWAKKTACD